VVLATQEEEEEEEKEGIGRTRDQFRISRRTLILI